MSESTTNHPQLNIDEILQSIRESVRKASNEAELKMGVSKVIEDKILKPLGITQVGKYEYTVGKYEYTLVSGAKVDALYGHVIVEYKAPGGLSTQSNIQKAKEQVIKYIKEEAGNKVEWDRYLGIIISDRIAFVRYDCRTDNWLLRGPYDITREVVIKIVEALKGLKRRALDVEPLIKDFGPKSNLAQNSIKLLYKKLKTSENPRTKTLFEDWMRLFKQATGYRPEELEELPKLAEEYKLGEKVDYDALIFAIHTYYALIMKFLAAEIAYLYGGGKFYRSYVSELDDAYTRSGLEGVKSSLIELESGGIFKKLLNIENFLEGDYFSWYLEELDKELADVIAEVARKLQDYEIATPQLEPEFARDLLKRLYQNLVPADLRHRLGEYYTPDWLAFLLLNEVGLSMEDLMKLGEKDALAPLNIRVLDPSCGSGTFLLLYISRLRRYSEEHFLTDQLLNYILENVVGYDLNPLAVLTARTNFLLAIADLFGFARGPIEIPIYLADSIMIEQRTQLTSAVYILRTAVGEFHVPKNVVDEGILRGILGEMASALRNRYSTDDFGKRIKYAFKNISENDISVLEKLYATLLRLEEEGKDEVWISILRNAFAPILKGKFDYVIGNPPWVNWENLPENYREVSKTLWIKYGLTEVKGKTGLGKVKRDFGMLFLARCFDLYLKEGGKLGFLFPFTAFKTQAGAGFRNFLARKTKLHVIHDLVTLYPFEGAVNRTAAIVVEKVFDLSRIEKSGMNELIDVFRSNMNGVRHVIWVNINKKPIQTDTSLEEVLKVTKRYEAIMVPIISNDPSSSWMQVTPNTINVIRKLIGKTPHYEAHAGVYVGVNQVYYVKVLSRMPDNKLVITNPPESGQKKEVKQIETVIEQDLVYPMIRGRDVKKWYVGYEDRYIILPHDPKSGKPLAERDLKIKLPLTYDYLNNYRNELLNRSIHKLWGKVNPFYSVYDIGSYTFAPYKVIWKNIAGAITGKAEFSCAVVGEINDNLVGRKIIIPNVKLMLVPLESLDEAHYLCGVLNSVIIRSIVASYVIETGISTHIIDFIKVPKYDPNNELHRQISELSKKAHELARRIYEENNVNLKEELARIEDYIDKAVARLLGLSDAELEEFKKLSMILSNEITLEEREEIIVPQEPIINVLNTSLQPGVESYIEIDVINPSGKEILFTYELLGKCDSFKIIEGKYKIPLPPLKPGKYSGVLKWVWQKKENSKDIIVEVSEPFGHKRKRIILE